MTLFGHPIARKMEDWWKQHADKHDDPEWIEYLSVFKTLLDEKFKEWSEEHTNTINGIKLYGMSGAGGCVRKATLKLLGYKEERESGSTFFTYWLGHNVEIAALATLHMCGYPLIGTQHKLVLETELNGKVEPLMASASDGIIKLFGIDTVVSVKSGAYKMSGQVKGRWIRRGFPEYPFSGVREVNQSAYAQLQMEMFAGGYSQGLFLIVSKDIVKAFENDDFLGNKGNGSLTFYAEMIKPELEVSEPIINAFSNGMLLARQGKASAALYPEKHTYNYVELKKAQYVPSNIWGGSNKELTKTFNPCGGCGLRKACENAL